MPEKELTPAKEKNLNREGRKKGSKNKSTLVKEALRGQFDDLLLAEGEKVFKAVVAKAIGDPLLDKEGNPIVDPETGEVVRIGADMSAAKLILDRVVPVQDEAGKLRITEGGIKIYIEKLEAQPAPSPAIEGEVEEAEYEEVAQKDQVIET